MGRAGGPSGLCDCGALWQCPRRCSLRSRSMRIGLTAKHPWLAGQRLVERVWQRMSGPEEGLSHRDKLVACAKDDPQRWCLGRRYATAVLSSAVKYTTQLAGELSHFSFERMHDLAMRQASRQLLRAGHSKLRRALACGRASANAKGTCGAMGSCGPKLCKNGACEPACGKGLTVQVGTKHAARRSELRMSPTACLRLRGS